MVGISDAWFQTLLHSLSSFVLSDKMCMESKFASHEQQNILENSDLSI